MRARALQQILSRIKARHVICGAVIFSALTFTASVTTGGDDSRYILMSRDFIRHGVLWTIMGSASFEAHCYALLPVLLMPFAAWSPDNFLLMKLVPFSASVAGLFLAHFFFKRELGGRGALAALVLYAFNPWILEYSGLLMTDMLYIPLAMGAIVLMGKYDEVRHAGYLSGASICCAFSLYTRPSGIALTAALLLYLAFRREWRAVLLSVVICGVIGALFFARIPVLMGGSVYQILMKEAYYSSADAGNGFAAVPLRMGYRLLVYAGNYLPDIFMRPFVSGITPRLPAGGVNPVFLLKFFSGAVLIFVMARGLTRQLKGGVCFYHLYAVVYMLLCLAFNAYVARYLVPLVPLMLVWLLKGMRFERRHRAVRIAVGCVCAVVMAASVMGSTGEVMAARTGYIPAHDRRFIECNEWVRLHVPEGALVLSRRPQYTILMTGRRAQGFLLSGSEGDYLKHIRDLGVDYVITADAGCFLHSGRVVSTLMERDPGDFVRVFSTKGAPHEDVYKVNRE